MKKSVVLIVSVFAGLLAAVLTYFYLSAKDAEVRELKDSINARFGTMEALCYLADTPSGTVLSRKDFGTKTVPKIGLNGQALTAENVTDILGRKTTIPHRRGDIVFWADIEGGDPALKNLSADIKRGMRAVSINCSGAASVSAMVRPNDHVDVIGTFDFEGGGSGKKNFVTCTLLQNVLVLATGGETGKLGSRASLGTPASGYSTVTLEVTLREAEMIAFAEQMKGRLMLALRNRTDVSYEKELPKIDFEKIRSEIEELNLRRQQQKLMMR